MGIFSWFKKVRGQKGPIKIHFETFSPAYSGTTMGQMACIGQVYVSAPDLKGNTHKEKVYCNNHTVTNHASANGNKDLLMTVCLDEINTVEDSMVVALLYIDGHIDAVRFFGSGEIERLSLDNIIAPTDGSELPEYFSAIAQFNLPGELNNSIRSLRSINR